MSILVSGSLVYDNIMNFPDSFKHHIMPDQIHILNVSFSVDRLEESRGGTAGNIAYNIALLGGEPLLVSAVGKDGQEYLKHLEKNKISTDYIIKDDKQMTASCYITTDADDNQITAFFGGPLLSAKEVELAAIKERPFVALISPTHKEVMTKHLLDCRERGIKTVFDPGQQITSFSGLELKKMVSLANFVIGNDYEIKLLEERVGWNKKEILANTEVLITTLGERGSLIETREGEKIEVGVCQPKSFDDPTGAGDAFRAGFFVGYELGYDWRVCAQMGSVAASYAIETFGTQDYSFSNEEFIARYEKAFGQKISLTR